MTPLPGTLQCQGPPWFTDVLFSDDGELVVFVEDDTIRPERLQPPQGWNCPAN